MGGQIDQNTCQC